ncbi:ATP phosphoribosyltransferase regulatory subunit [Paraliobacillus sp. PM-2]|uniref:ATP phosphoribosyltransferase regulatory subunit n=1 Tax=Paraliobacillus sp. PM-2 TaxID=1462524 RepID=UPI00061B8E0A|nr:ATP phosphoribosyltransferase regulatory subunit [Paraliobacillus sp. PM-2]CQR47582.1 ATP phosphoribosyltransferase regulatory subunit [Paraliobacillus sp. PM-2]
MFLPEGSQDETGLILDKKAKATELFRKVAITRGFKAISTPVVEYATTFTNPHVGMKLHSLLKWFNREGEIEVLRADWTTAIARALITQQSTQTKWFYEGSVFRNDKDGIESKQAGIEMIRTEPFLGEAESVLTAVAYLNELGITNYLIELGHTGIFEELTASLSLDEKTESCLREAMHDKRKDIVYDIALNHGSPEKAAQLTQLIDAYGTVEELKKYQSIWKDNQRLSNIFSHLMDLAKVIESSGVGEVLIDLGRVKNLPYYCGTMFRGYLKEKGESCFSGGRYDKLYEQFDEKVSAVGLAFDLDVLAKHFKNQQSKEKICILASIETHVKAETLRTLYPNALVDIQYEIKNRDNYDKIINVDNQIVKIN